MTGRQTSIWLVSVSVSASGVASSAETVVVPSSAKRCCTVSSAIAAGEANIHNLSMHVGSPDFHSFVIEIEVRDLAQLTDVIATLRLTPGLSDVRRATAAEAGVLTKIEWNANRKEPA